MGVRLSHLELVVSDMEPMECFYSDTLGFRVSDRSTMAGDGQMVFLTQDPDEHHQLVLRQAAGRMRDTLLDHVAFRVDSLDELRTVHRRAVGAQIQHIETVSHGSTWSVYVPDPESNRVEFFVDTPWLVAQPCRFQIDLSLSDDDLIAATKSHIRDLELLDPIKNR